MAKMYFAKTVRYHGSVYPPNTTFEVKDVDVDGLKQSGGWIIVEEPQPGNPELDKEAEFELLKEQAAELGIEVKGNWGVKKLTEVIAEASEAQ